MSEYGDSFLLAPFREFYSEIIRLKQMVSVGAWASAPQNSPAKSNGGQGQKGRWIYLPDVVDEDAATADDDVARLTGRNWPEAEESTSALMRAEDGTGSAVDFSGQFQPSNSDRMSALIWHELASLLQRQEVTARRYGGAYGAEFYREAEFVMVALADEIFLYMKWEGQRAWVSNLLESKRFNTHTAGEVFFNNIERILQDQNPVYRDLAAVYLMALSLGFKGKYHDRDHGQIARYRRRLFAFICRREPDLDDEARRLFPEAYYHNVREESQRKLSDPRKWLLVLALVLIVYTAATHALWVQFTLDLNKINQSISQVVTKLKMPTSTSSR